MPNVSLRGKSLKAITSDISEGYITVNPIFLKPLDTESLKTLHSEVLKKQAEVRNESFPYSNIEAIRIRNMRLQRLNTAALIIKNFAKEKRLKII